MKNKEIILHLSKELAKELVIASRDTYHTVKPIVINGIRRALERSTVFIEKSLGRINQCWQHSISPFLGKCAITGRMQLRHHCRKLALCAAMIAIVTGVVITISNFESGASAVDTSTAPIILLVDDKESDAGQPITLSQKHSESEPAPQVAEDCLEKDNHQPIMPIQAASDSGNDGLFGLSYHSNSPVDLGMGGGYERQMEHARYQAEQSSNSEMRRYQSHLNATLSARGVR